MGVGKEITKRIAGGGGGAVAGYVIGRPIGYVVGLFSGNPRIAESTADFFQIAFTLGGAYGGYQLAAGFKGKIEELPKHEKIKFRETKEGTYKLSVPSTKPKSGIVATKELSKVEEMSSPLIRLLKREMPQEYEDVRKLILSSQTSYKTRRLPEESRNGKYFVRGTNLEIKDFPSLWVPEEIYSLHQKFLSRRQSQQSTKPDESGFKIPDFLKREASEAIENLLKREMPQDFDSLKRKLSQSPSTELKSLPTEFKGEGTVIVGTDFDARDYKSLLVPEEVYNLYETWLNRRGYKPVSHPPQKEVSTQSLESELVKRDYSKPPELKEDQLGIIEKGLKVKLAQALWKRGDYYDAAKEYEAAWLLDPEDSDLEEILLRKIPEKLSLMPSQTASTTAKLYFVRMQELVGRVKNIKTKPQVEKIFVPFGAMQIPVYKEGERYRAEGIEVSEDDPDIAALHYVKRKTSFNIDIEAEKRRIALKQKS